MYESYFGLSEKPFSIAPDPQYLFMSRQHQEAMAHLSYGLTQGGGFILLTGEVGTGKTTLCRNLLSQLPESVDVALILNANIQEDELLQTICDELKIQYQADDSQKTLLNKLNEFLLNSFSNNRRTVLIIDESQLLSRDVLEQIRLLTNLETTKAKLLQIILIGQPELNEVLAREDLRQLAQRITARYHLKSIDKQDITDYVTTRLKVAGCTRALFTKQALSKVYTLTKGIPRLINVLCDNALLVAYSKGSDLVDAKIVKLASKEILNPVQVRQPSRISKFFKVYKRKLAWLGLLAALLFGLFKFWPQLESFMPSFKGPDVNTTKVSATSTSDQAALDSSLKEKESDEVLLGATGTETEDESSDKESLVTKQVTDQTNEKATRVDDLTALLTSPSIDTTRASAFRRMANLWGYELPEKAIKPLCSSVRELTLDCYAAKTDLETLLSYGRPASLLLNSEEGQHRVLLLGSAENDLLLDIDGQQYIVTKQALQNLWNGDFLFYWQRPEINNYVFTEGATGSRVVWLRQQLNFALRSVGEKGLNNTSRPVYDQELAASVRQIQIDNGIPVDGQVGMRTLMLINQMIDPSLVPTLHKLQNSADTNSDEKGSVEVVDEVEQSTQSQQVQ